MAVEKHFLDAISDILNPKRDSRALCINVSSVFSIIKDSGDITTSCIESTGEILIELLKRYKAKKSNSEEREDLMSAYQEGVECLNQTCKYNIVHDVRRCALRTLMDLLPEEARYVQEKPALLPVNQFSFNFKRVTKVYVPLSFVSCLIFLLYLFCRLDIILRGEQLQVNHSTTPSAKTFDKKQETTERGSYTFVILS
ncbi:hypothetical protein AAG570_011173 [Ranatra chinensis]|uniref:Uncharacterized protein n=1 Tax=Ranatra chinensis TaxID=642074 RepID=A0ABD0YK40_9HEMI